ncbi:uncharacterized protein MELLADRAFT_123567 [Melampsora larici-populina 98AG31]|uniref:Secreted protein n=1 Tax=Melampsora larici-populina (strain 98AG31 / pathotype 3-4-7) TaxID=747676 RepID=F4R441_MELLP|nr:uncharacterized protein MELLADRAFT_123567 [Melampsora larici-populina 98AG31]EGG12735.1 secreted protein [Melampsora larici-populina 98AG31]
MLHVFPKTSLLLIFLWLHCLKALDNKFYCNSGFKRDTDTNAVCLLKHSVLPGSAMYNCAYSSCWYNGSKWSPMSGCQLIGSLDKGISNQKCTIYEYNEKKYNIACTNAGGTSYTCPYTASTVPAILCTDCAYVRSRDP